MKRQIGIGTGIEIKMILINEVFLVVLTDLVPLYVSLIQMVMKV